MAGIRKRRRLADGQVKDRIDLIGVELEGGWVDPPPTTVERDGSVHVNGQTETDPVTGKSKTILVSYEGEVVSRPVRTNEFADWMRQNYPRHVNATCGLHVHMSFKSRLNYQRLMTPEFTKFMVEKLKAWAKKEGLPADHWIWPRLNDPNHNHCAHIYLGDGQVKMRKKDYHSRGTTHSRYTAINYCYGQHQTVECRLLSMLKDPEMGIRGVQCVLDSTNEFLAKQRERERKIAAQVEDSPSVATRLHQFV